MRETEISLLDKEEVPAAALFQKLLSMGPNLTVYYLYKTFKEGWSQRFGLRSSSFTGNGDIHLEELLND